MLTEKIQFLLGSLDMHLALGKTPADAWNAAIEDYAEVYHSKDERTIIQRAATVELRRMEECDESNSPNQME